MVKVRDKRKLKWCLVNYNSGKITQKWASKHLGVTPRRFRQINQQYKTTGTIPDVGANNGRPTKHISAESVRIIKQAYEKDHLNAVYLEQIIYHRLGISIPHSSIHEVLLELGYANNEESKQKRRKPWIRYERAHSLSLVHTDYHYCENGKYLCAILDDASRKILAAGEFDNKTTQNALIVLKRACEECKPLYPILSILTDHGSEFYANKRDVKGYAEHEYEQFLEAQGIKHIMCAVNHPQTNGKLEKWHDCYIHHRGRFDSLEEFVLWYNNRPHGALNLHIAETPSEVFMRRMSPEVLLGLAAKLFGWG
jgi:putative transposase